jgi:hypothetical protein
MPFDCTPITNAPVRLRALNSNLLDFGASRLPADATNPRPIPAWHSSRRPETVGNTLAVLVRARVLLADEQRWCQRSFARSWLKMPVPPQSALAGRFCAIGAIMRAGRELGLPYQDACIALEWQTARPIEDWNDDPQRTHADVIATFDGAVMALETSAG